MRARHEQTYAFSNINLPSEYELGGEGEVGRLCFYFVTVLRQYVDTLNHHLNV